MRTFHGPFRQELEEFLALRQASLSPSAYAHEGHYLMDFDTFLAQESHEKSIS